MRPPARHRLSWVVVLGACAPGVARETLALPHHASAHGAALPDGRAFAWSQPEDAAALTASIAQRVDDAVLYHGARARPPILAAYHVLSTLAAYDDAIHSALGPARDFYGAPSRKAARSRGATAPADDTTGA